MNECVFRLTDRVNARRLLASGRHWRRIETGDTELEHVALGFIVAVNDLIYGYGKTEKDAVEDALTTLRNARIIVIKDDDAEPEDNSWVHEDALWTVPATAQLLEMVETQGGDIGFWDLNGVACTLDEAWDAGEKEVE
jgi:hypothetical protein